MAQRADAVAGNLVLKRRPGDSILIGDDIRITMVRLDGGAAILSVEAPKDCRILRGELKPGSGLESAARLVVRAWERSGSEGPEPDEVRKARLVLDEEGQP